MNYHKELEKLIKQIREGNAKPNLLLHSCCGPCSSYVISFLRDFFDVTVLYYNPNIQPEEEYLKRKNEQIRLINEMNNASPGEAGRGKVTFIDIDYEPEKYEQIAIGLAHEKEGGVRCTECFRLRLRKTAEMAKLNNYDYYGTTLTVSPHKNATKINEIGYSIEKELGIKWLISDFKKNEGYKKSIELSKKYNLYRQNYCGCLYSKAKL